MLYRVGPINISYEYVSRYHRDLDGVYRPYVPIRITYNGIATDKLALVDSGADLPTFPRTIAEILRIDLDELPRGESRTAGGPIASWRCECELTTLPGIQEKCLVAIVDNEDCPYLLGRKPFFSLMQVGFRESRLEFYLTPEP